MSPKIKNRLKVVLAENERTNKWLAAQIGKDETSVSRWCTNKSQPSLETLGQIAYLLNIDVRELISPHGKTIVKEVTHG